MNLLKDRYLLLLLLSAIFFASCDPQTQSNTTNDTLPKKTVQTDTAVAGNFVASSGIKLDSNQIATFIKLYPLFKQFEPELYKFYQTNQYNYVWYDKQGLTEFSGQLVTKITTLDQQGVNPSIPYQEAFLKLVDYDESENNEDHSSPDINTELMLTAQYFNYAKKTSAGSLNSKAESMNWYLPRKKILYADLLAKDLAQNSLTIDAGPIVTQQYNGLQKALAQYRELEKNDQIKTVPALSKPSVLKINDSSSVVALIKKQLFLLGYLNNSDTSKIFDAQFADAVNNFKITHGLKADSTITNSMIKELNVPVKKRIGQIMVNMERLRWIPADSSTNEFILVNIPAFTLHYYEDKKIILECNVVVGKPMNKTVVFSGQMQYVVFSPYWNVPTSIINKEIKPAMRRNPNYLASHNMEWNGGRVRQKPGPNNALGLVKFLFPNANNIYLHDTPSKSLFSQDVRAFSHGCIRVSKPRDLAILVLRQDSAWTPEKIDAAMHAGVEKYVTLKKTIPVYIGYFTCFIDANGNVNFRNDIYSRDNSLLDMLMQD